MSYKILTKNGIDNSNIDGARGEYFNSGMRDGIVQGVLNEGTFIASSSNVISLDTCELRIAGHRIVIDEPVYHTFSNAPSSDTRYAFVAQIIVGSDQSVEFSLFVQAASTPLIQNDLYKTISGAGTYQVEIGRFTLLRTLTIEDVVRTIDVITGGTGKGSGSTINIGNVTTQTLDPDVDAEVDVSERYEEDEGKEYLDFKFSIPKGDKGDTNSLSIGTVTTGEAGSKASATITGDAPNQTLNLTIPKGDTGTGEDALVYTGIYANMGVPVVGNNYGIPLDGFNRTPNINEGLFVLFRDLDDNNVIYLTTGKINSISGNAMYNVLSSYRLTGQKGDTPTFDASDLRARRERECFSYINRGVLWYNTLTTEQQQELNTWYQQWLNVPQVYLETKPTDIENIIPSKPIWLK